MFRAVIAVLLLTAGPAGATCMLGSISGTVPWDLSGCKSDPTMTTDNYAATITGATVLSPPANMPPGGDKVITLVVNYGAGGSLSLGSGFVGTLDQANPQPPFTNKAGTYDEVICQIHPADNPVGQAYCEFHYNLHKIGLPAGIARVNGAVGALAGSGTVASVVVAPAGANAYLCLVSANGGADPPNGVADDAGNSLTKFSENSGADGTDHSVWGKIGITGSPTTVKATWGGTHTNVQISCDYFSGVASFGATRPPNFQRSPSTVANSITSSSAPVATNNALWGVTVATGSKAPGGSTTISPGTGFTAGFHDTTANHWGVTSEYQKIAGGTTAAAATFTDANTGSMYYLTSAVVLQ